MRSCSFSTVSIACHLLFASHVSEFFNINSIRFASLIVVPHFTVISWRSSAKRGQWKGTCSAGSTLLTRAGQSGKLTWHGTWEDNYGNTHGRRGTEWCRSWLRRVFYSTMQRCSGSVHVSYAPLQNNPHFLIERSFAEDLDNPAFGTPEKLQHCLVGYCVNRHKQLS